MAVDYNLLDVGSREDALLYIGSQFKEENSQTLEGIDGGYLTSAGYSLRLKTASETSQQGPLDRYLSRTSKEDAWAATGWTRMT